MKALLTIAVIALTGCATPQPFTGPAPSKVIKVDATASELFQGSRQWIAENFRSANNVIQYQDEATNTVIGRGSLANSVCIDLVYNYIPLTDKNKLACMDTTSLDFVMKMEAKDGKMKITMPSASYTPKTSNTSVPANQALMDGFTDTVLGYGDKIAEYVTGNGKSDW